MTRRRGPGAARPHELEQRAAADDPRSVARARYDRAVAALGGDRYAVHERLVLCVARLAQRPPLGTLTHPLDGWIAELESERGDAEKRARLEEQLQVARHVRELDIARRLASGERIRRVTRLEWRWPVLELVDALGWQGAEVARLLAESRYWSSPPLGCRPLQKRGPKSIEKELSDLRRILLKAQQ